MGKHRTASAETFWRRPDVTRLVKLAPTDQASAKELAGLTFKPFLHQVDAFLQKSKLGRLNIQPEELFDVLWMGGMATAMRTVDFNDRTHYLNTFLLRARNLAQRLAKTRRRNSGRTVSLVAEHIETLRDPTDTAADLEQISRVLQILDELPGELRDAIQAWFFEGLTLREIAIEQKASFSGVKARIDRALMILQQRMQDDA